MKHKAGNIILSVLMMVLTAFYSCGAEEPEIPGEPGQAIEDDREQDVGDNKAERTMVIMTVGGTSYDVRLYEGKPSESFLEMLPLTIEMKELNGNEKYCYLDKTIPTEASLVGGISKGDIMLWGSDCLVVFYKSFTTSYSYTRIGHIENPDGLEAALGRGDVKITFSRK